MFENLLGGFVEDGYFVPVRFGLKHTNEGKAVLYVVVNQQKIDIEKIKAEVVNTATTNKLQSTVSRSAYVINISDLLPFVNDGDVLRYIPDDMLSLKQKEIKWEAIAQTIARTNNKNDDHYIEAVKNGDKGLIATIVKAAAKDAGYTTSGFHGSRTPGFTVVDKYS